MSTVSTQWDLRAYLGSLLTGVLALVIVLGSAALWIGIPVLGLWLAGQLFDTPTGFLFATLGGIPLAMVAFGWVLYRINDLYLRRHADGGGVQTKQSAWLRSLSDERGRERRAREPRPLIDIAMTLSASAALVLLAIWFFFFSEMLLVSPL